MEISTVSVFYINMILESLAEQGWDRHKLLEKTNFSQEVLSEKKARIPRSDYVKFAARLAMQMQDECFGLLEQPMKPGTFAMLCHACINCENLEHFLRRFNKFWSVVNNSFELRLVRSGESARCYVIPAEGRVHASNLIVMLAMAVTHRLSSWTIDRTIALKSVHLTCERPENADDYNLLLAAPIQFCQAENAIEFHSDYLDTTIEKDELELRDFLKSSAIQLMSELELDSSLSAQIKAMIKKDSKDTFKTFEEIAQALGFATATLRRRLRSEGVTYQDIKDSVRRDSAIYYLSRTTMSLDEVAEMAGFSEPTSFYRAFKRWTGTSPRAYSSPS